MSDLLRRIVSSGPGESSLTWRNIGRSAGVKMLVLPLSAVLGIIITRLIIDNFGEAAFAQYGLLVGIGALLPFADLGVSAAVMNAVGGSADPARDEYVRRILLTSLRVLMLSASVLLLVNVVITAGGWWPTLLGEGLDPDTGSSVAALCFAMIAITLPFAIGQRILAALGKNHVSIALGGLQSPIVLAVLALALALGATSGDFVPVVAYVATFVIALLALGIAARYVGPALLAAVRQVRHVRRARGARVVDVAWPMMVQMIALPIAMQTDRLVLSHVGGVAELAQYNLAAQMFTPIWGIVSAAGFTLWPVFARARIIGAKDSPVPMSLVFGAAAAGLALVVALASPWLAQIASGGVITLDVALVAAFSLFMIVQGLKYPLGMFMTDARGLRYQAVMIVLMVPVNLGLSIVLAKSLGATGPVIGSFLGVLAFQVVANYVYVRRALRLRQPADVESM